jgi:hypothetical protein
MERMAKEIMDLTAWNPQISLGTIPTKLRPGKSVYESRFGINKLGEINQN